MAPAHRYRDLVFGADTDLMQVVIPHLCTPSRHPTVAEVFDVDQMQRRSLHHVPGDYGPSHRYSDRSAPSIGRGAPWNRISAIMRRADLLPHQRPKCQVKSLEVVYDVVA